MKQPKFIKLYQALGKREKNDFAVYLQAMLPTDSIPLKVFHYLMEGDLEHQFSLLIKEKVLNTIYDVKKNLSKSLSNTFSDLQKQLEDFLTFRKLKQNKQLQELLLLEVFQEKKLEQFADSLFGKAIKDLEKKEGKDQKDYLHAMRLHEFHFYNSRTPKLDSNTGIEKCMEYLDLFFVTNKFKLAAEMRNRETFISEQHKVKLLAESETFLQEQEMDKAPASTLFFLAFKFNEKASEETYLALKEKFFLFIDRLTGLDKNILLSYLINYTAREFRKSTPGILSESFDLHKLGVEKKLFLSDGYLSPVKFTNIVELGCKVKQFKWVNAFIKNSQHHLPKPIRASVILVCQAIIQFEKGAYEKVLESLAVFKHKDIFLNIRVKSLIIKSLYELHEGIELILAQCHNFDVYLSRKKIAGESVTKGCKNFNKFLRKLLRPNAKSDKLALLEELKETDPIVYEIWLKLKIKEL